MACNDYSNNGSPQVTFTMGTLPGGFCPATYQALFDAVAQYISGTLPGNYSTFIISDTTPVATDRDKLWLKVNSTNCRPEGFWLYNNSLAAWIPVGQQVWNGDATGTANAISCTFSPTLGYLKDGDLFIIKASSANTGAATLNPSSLGIKDIKKQGGKALAGGEILPNMLCLFTYRLAADDFEILNPALASAAYPENRVFNGSFETDSDGDGQPDNWTLTAIGAGSGTLSTSVVAHGGKSYAVTVSATGGGTLAQNELLPCNNGEILAVSFWNRTSNTGTTDLATVEWFDSASASLGAATTIWSGGASRTVDTWERVFAGMVAPATARFFKLRLVGGSTGAATGTVYFDGVLVDTVVFKRKTHYFYTGAATTKTWSFIAPSGVTMVKCTVVGGGGTGGYGGGHGSGGGGGAGGTAIALTPVTPGTHVLVTVGQGGQGGVGTVAAGNNSSFNGVVGNGGGAATGAAVTPGTGGSGTIPAGSAGWILTGGNGITGTVTAGDPGGHGGTGWGGGGVGAVNPNNGTVGGDYGGGGGGASQGGGTSGSGGNGYVLIEY